MAWDCDHASSMTCLVQERLPSGLRLLLVPENPIAVGHARDKIGQAVTVNVFHVDESDRTQVELRVKSPLSISWISRRLKPPLGCEDVVPPIFIKVTQSDAMPVTFLV